MDPDGCVIDWNQQAEITFGWARRQMIGHRIVERIIPEQYREQFEEGLRRFLETKESAILNKRVEVEALRSDGTEFPVELSVIVVEQNSQPLFVAFIRDISEKKAAEHRIERRKLEKQLLQHANLLSASHHSFDDALRTSIANLGEITKWPVGHAFVLDDSEEYLVSAEIWHVAKGNTFPVLRTASARAKLARGEDLPGRIWQSGEAAWITDITRDDNITRFSHPSQLGVQSAFGIPVKVDGQIAAVIEFFNSEVTPPDAHLLALARGVGDQLGRLLESMRGQNEQKRLAAIVDSSGDAIIGKDSRGRIFSWNTGAEHVYGWTADEVIGETISIILPLGVDEEEPEILEAMQTGRRLEQFETKRRRRNGEVIDVSITVSPIHGHDSRIVGSSTIERDITARRRRERELQEARDAANQANRARGEFLANVSHELRTPMNAILGMLELALQDDLTTGLRDYLKTAKDSADSLLLLVNDILDFSRLESGRFELDNFPFNLRDAMDDAVKTLSLRAQEKGLELVCSVDSRIPSRLFGDAMRLRQIVTNLAGNAIKFTERGEVVVHVKLRDHEQRSQSASLQNRELSEESIDTLPGDVLRLEFCVADTGIGISPADQERIFAPFTQADASTTREYSGTGLGLSICNELVDLMDGRIWLESELGQGSRFYIEVALQVADSIESDVQRERATVDELRGLPVLVIDDNQTNRLILQEMLNNWSMKPTIAASADEAFHQLDAAGEKDQKYPLIIVDALMPETDGFVLVEQAQKTGRLEGATILMLSSADRQLFNDRCESLDIAAFLEKPVSQSDLLDAIMKALNGPQLERGSVKQIVPGGKSLDILIVEDTPANQKVVAAILKKRGHRTVIANNGREALDCLRGDEFDVVLMDVQMPIMDGLQATAAIRESETGSDEHIPIIAMTAHAMRGDREKCLAAGMDEYIAKPIDSAKLIHLLERLVPLAGPQRNDLQEGPSTTSKSATSNVGQTAEPVDIDLRAAFARLGNDRGMLNDMVTFFLEDSPELLQCIRRATDEDNAEEVARAAHSLKGLCANFDAHSAADAAREVETIGRAGKLNSAATAIATLEEHVEKLATNLKRWQQKNM